VTLIYHHIFAVNDWNVGTVTRFHGHHDMYRNPVR